MCIYVHTLHNMEMLVGQGKYKNWDSSECCVPGVRQPWSSVPPSDLHSTNTHEYTPKSRLGHCPLGQLANCYTPVLLGFPVYDAV